MSHKHDTQTNGITEENEMGMDPSDEAGSLPTVEIAMALAQHASFLLKEQMEAHPYRVLGVALGAGYLLASVSSRPTRTAWWRTPLAAWAAKRALSFAMQQLMSNVAKKPTKPKKEPSLG